MERLTEYAGKLGDGEQDLAPPVESADDFGYIAERLARSAEQLQSDLRNLEISAQGSALYETTAAAEHRSRREGISRDQAFAQELTPERYTRYEREHQELDVGAKRKKKRLSRTSFLKM